MEGMVMVIEQTQGSWLVNGRRLNELSKWEKEFMNDFFKEVKPKPNQEIKLEVKNFQQLNIQK